MTVFFFTDVPTFVQFVHGLELPSAAIMSAKGLVAYPFFYHLCNGVRHLVSLNEHNIYFCSKKLTLFLV